MDPFNPATFAEGVQPLDVLDFVDSPAIRTHWEKIGWNPSPIEASFIIWYSRNRTIAEKHAAWRNLIETTPDVIFPEYMDHLKGKSLHAFLGAYVRIQEQLLDDLRSPEPGEACCWIVQKPRIDHTKVSIRPNAYILPSFDGAICKLRDCIDDKDWRLGEDRFILRKQRFGEEPDERDYDSDVTVLVSPNLEPITFVYSDSPLLTRKGKDVLEPGFEGMWFNLPLPFKRGDILVHRSRLYGNESRIVFDHDATLNNALDLYADTLRLLRKSDDYTKAWIHELDYTDMSVVGHKVDAESGVIQFCHGYSDLLSLEPCDGELEGFERKLEPLSRFFRGEIDLKRCLQECEALHAQVREELEAKRRKAQLKEVRRMYETQSDELCYAMLPAELLNLLG